MLAARLHLTPVLLALLVAPSASAGDGYAVVVRQATRDDPRWGAVVAALVATHHAEVVSYSSSVAEALPRLKSLFPRYACFVTRPEEAGRVFVARVHTLVRSLDDDPYDDLRWGILTGYDADAALRIARRSEPLTVRNVAAGTEVALDMCESGVWYDELRRGHSVEKPLGGSPADRTAPDDTTESLARAFDGADLFVTSGHATERDWQIGYSYRNGQFRSSAGHLFGIDTTGRRFPVRSARPKIYLAVGNCLMGHVDGPDAMALAWMNDAGVCQMAGYTEPTWYGYMGWGLLDYFLEQPGRFTLAEAFLANHHALTHRLGAPGLAPSDRQGLEFDRDCVAFYGDPAWEARMADRPKTWDQSLSVSGDELYTLTITPNRGAQTFRPVNTNGSQRGGRPVVQFLPHRVGAAEVVEGADLKPTITDDFILVPIPGTYDPDRAYRVSFRAKPVPR
jgi:hypothetical protein